MNHSELCEILIASRIPPAPISYSRIHSQGYRRSGPRVDHHVSFKLKLLSRETATNGSVEARCNEPNGPTFGSRSAQSQARGFPERSGSVPGGLPKGSRKAPGGFLQGCRRAPGGLEAQKTKIKNNVCFLNDLEAALGSRRLPEASRRLPERLEARTTKK